MATECTQEAVLRFLTERGGRVKNTDLMDHFKTIFPDERERKATVREKFKSYVDNIAFVKTENGVKFVCVRKSYRYSLKDGTRAGTVPVVSGKQDRVGSGVVDRAESVSAGRTEIVRVNNEAVIMGPPPPRRPPAGSAARGDVEAQQHIPAVSGYGSDVSQVRDSPVSSESILADKTEDNIVGCPKFVEFQEVGDNTSEFDMGNVLGLTTSEKRRPSIVRTNNPVPDIPHIAVIQASPLPADGSIFVLPGCQNPGPVDSCVRLSPKDPGDRLRFAEDTVDGHVESEPVSLGVPRGSNENQVTMRRTARGSPQSSASGHHLDDGADEGGPSDWHSLSGSEGNASPKGSRKSFLEHMLNTSPQVRHSVALRNSTYLSGRYDERTRGGDSDAASLASSSADEDRPVVTLDPLEHEWMMCASDGEWAALHDLLTCEPNLISKKDFITGFTCLHWAAKQGKPELLALIVNFAKQHATPININARSSAGYTPLHLAAMHDHADVVKLLVGAYDADVDVRDYNGKRASQYLADGVAVDIRDIIGAQGDSDSESADAVDGSGRWRFSKVLQSKRKSLIKKGSFKSRPKSNLFG